jgi:5-methylcytosine-specific restriction endonuclease McrA
MLEEYIIEYKSFNDSITEERKAVLIELASRSKRGLYEQQYEWKKRRELRIKIADSKCENCGCKQTILHAHHLCYERYGNENYDDLQILCEICHAAEHKNKPCLDRMHVVKQISLGELFDKMLF